MIKIFDISTLVTDRTQADVQAWNDKGTYNPSDLNRVTHAMEYLVERIRSYGYAVKYEKVKVPHQPQKGKSRLPAGYTELEYIESSGTQYIDTGVMPNNNTRMRLRFARTETASTWVTVCGARTSSSAGMFCVALNGHAVITYYNAATNNTGKSITDTNFHIIDKDKNLTYVDGVLSNTATSATFSTTYPISLFGFNNGGSTVGGAIKISECQIYDNGTLVRDFVPCKNASGTIGLYDVVNGKFYTNTGTGAFTAGSEVELPLVEILDDYTWYHSDIPQANELNAYLQNVRWLRESMVLLPNTPEVPADMQGFTFAEANDIEQILVNIETIINLMLSSIIYSGEIFSGEVI